MSTTALRDTTANNAEWLRGAATELHYSVHASVEDSAVEGLGYALQFMLAPDLSEAVFADQVNLLSELSESEGKRLQLFSALLLEL